MSVKDEYRKRLQESTRPADKRKRTIGRLETDAITILLRELGLTGVLRAAWDEAKNKQNKHYLSCPILESVWQECPFYMRSYVTEGRVCSCPSSIAAYVTDWTQMPMVKMFSQVRDAARQEGHAVACMILHIPKLKTPMLIREGSTGPIIGPRIMFGDEDGAYVIESVKQFAMLVRSLLD